MAFDHTLEEALTQALLDYPMQGAIAEMVFPPAIAPSKKGSVKKIDDDDGTAAPDPDELGTLKKNPWEPAVDSIIEVEDVDYDIEQHELFTAVPSTLEDGGLSALADASFYQEYLFKQLMLGKEMQAQTLAFTAANWGATANATDWKTATHNPVDDIITGVVAAAKSGLSPNQLTFGFQSFLNFCNNPLVKAPSIYVAEGDSSLPLAADGTPLNDRKMEAIVLSVVQPQLPFIQRVNVGTAVMNGDFIWGDSVLVSHNDGPIDMGMRNTAGFASGYTIRYGYDRRTQVKDNPNPAGLGITVYMPRQFKVFQSTSGYLITGTNS